MLNKDEMAFLESNLADIELLEYDVDALLNIFVNNSSSAVAVSLRKPFGRVMMFRYLMGI